MQNQTKLVEVTISDRIFTKEVTAWTEGGDYYTPADSGYELDSEVYDEDGNNVTKLIARYEDIYDFDFDARAIDNFND